MIPGDQPEEEIDGYGGKDFETKKFYDESGKHNEKGQQSVQDHNMTMEKSWMMMKDRTHNEHEEIRNMKFLLHLLSWLARPLFGCFCPYGYHRCSELLHRNRN